MDMLRCLETFCAVVETGSFTAAAEKRYLTQPSVSTHIRDLEKHYSTKLLNRRRDRITPTDTGKHLYKHARNLLKMAKETEDAIDSINNLIRGEVTIGASSVPGTYLVPVMLSAFKKEYPGIHLAMEVSDTSIVIDQVFDQRVDFGIVGEKRKKPGLIYTSIAKDTIVLATHPSTGRGPINPDELKSMPLILREHTSGTRMAVQEKLREKGIAEKDLHIVMELGSTEAVKQGIMAGLGGGFVSELSIKNEEKHGMLKRLLFKNLTINRHFWMVKRTKGDLSRASQALYEYIRKERF
jgi:DNA-binding transcriptional LysR family regulator